MIKRLKEIYQLQMFYPGWFGIFVNPFYFARSGLRNAMTEFAPMLSGRLLDVGCGTKPYQALFAVDVYIGLDIDSEVSRKRGIADHHYDGNTFPFVDASFDSVLCNQVLEHVFNPDEFLGEIVRVLRPGGKLLLTVPFVWDEHEQPYDYARYSSYGLHALLEKQGFKVLHHMKLGADASILFQLTNAYLFKVTQGLPRSLKLLFTSSVMAIVNVMGLLARGLLPNNPDLFLDQVILVEKPLEFI
jgi:SAM-dependent methyltransferase